MKLFLLFGAAQMMRPRGWVSHVAGESFLFDDVSRNYWEIMWGPTLELMIAVWSSVADLGETLSYLTRHENCSLG